jgi:hypothetical protein
MPKFPPGAHLKGGQAAAESNRQLAREFYGPILPIVLELHRQGLSLRAIGRELDRRGIMTRLGWPCWSAPSVRRALDWALEAEAGRKPGPAAQMLGGD